MWRVPYPIRPDCQCALSPLLALLLLSLLPFPFSRTLPDDRVPSSLRAFPLPLVLSFFFSSFFLLLSHATSLPRRSQPPPPTTRRPPVDLISSSPSSSSSLTSTASSSYAEYSSPCVNVFLRSSSFASLFLFFVALLIRLGSFYLPLPLFYYSSSVLSLPFFFFLFFCLRQSG